MKRNLCLLLSLLLCFLSFPQISLADNAPSGLTWQHSKSKKATKLSENLESQITLSLPSSETNLKSDIIFVLDKSSCRSETAQAAEDLFDKLTEMVSRNNANIKIAVIAFDGDTHLLYDLQNFNGSPEEIKKINSMLAANSIPPEQKLSGTNMHAGLLQCKDILDKDLEVPNERKNVILISDGLTRLFSDNTNYHDIKDIYWQTNYSEKGMVGAEKDGNPKSWVYFGMIDEWSTARSVLHNHGEYPTPYGDWNTYFKKVTEWVKTDRDNYSMDFKKYGNDATEKVKDPKNGDIIDSNFRFIPNTEFDQHAMAVDRAVYEAYHAYQSLVDSHYNVYANCVGKAEFGQTFMTELNKLSNHKDKDSFPLITNDIIYLLDKNSEVVDYLGDTKEEGIFTLIHPEEITITLTSSDNEKNKILKANEISKNHFVFGDKTKDNIYPYEVFYTPKGPSSGEYFRWKINVPVTNFERVSLSYTVKLINPKINPGEYTVYPNKEAILTPVNSNGEKSEKEIFERPVLNYIIPEIPEKHHHSGGGGHSNYIPQKVTPSNNNKLNMEDHYAYMFGYPEKDFRAERPMTRGEVAAMFSRLMKKYPEKGYYKVSNYNDVKTSDWFFEPVEYMRETGVISGYPDGTFRGNAFITRAEFATIAARFDKLTSNDRTFSDVAPDFWASKYISSAAAKGWVNGYPDGTFKPMRDISRAEVITITNHMLNREADDAFVNHNKAEIINFTDLQPSYWAYYDIVESTNGHDYERKANDHSEIWEKLNHKEFLYPVLNETNRYFKYNG